MSIKSKQKKVGPSV